MTVSLHTSMKFKTTSSIFFVFLLQGEKKKEEEEVVSNLKYVGNETVPTDQGQDLLHDLNSVITNKISERSIITGNHRCIEIDVPICIFRLTNIVFIILGSSLLISSMCITVYTTSVAFEYTCSWNDASLDESSPF